jgi:hypothetical protein
MKQLISCILIIIPFLAAGQTYSELIDDTKIEEVLQYDILHSSKFPEDRRIGRKKVYVEPAYWDGAFPFENIKLEDTLSFQLVFKWFIEDDSIFSETDKQFMEEQFQAALRVDWTGNFKGARLSTNYSKRIYQYSIPLFSLDKNLVMFHKYFYCGNLCARACTYVYQRTGMDKWELVKEYKCWMS